MVARIDEENILALNIGNELDEKCDEYIIECTDAFLYFVKFHYRILEPVKVSKDSMDSNI